MSEDEAMPLRGGVCDEHGEFNNFSGKCLACTFPGRVTGQEPK